jgi:biotin operon repressor
VPGLPPLADRDRLEHLYIEHGSVRGVARELGCSRNAVRAALERHGIELLPAHRARPPQLDDRQWLHHAYHRQHRSARSIAEELGCSAGMVLAALHRLDIVTRPKRPRPSPLLADRRFLWKRYWAERKSIVAIANELACSPGAVRAALFRHGIEVRAAGAPRIDQLYDREWLAAAAARSTPAEMATTLGCSEVTVRWALWRSGIAPGPGRRQRPAALDDVTYLFRTYVTEGRSARGIAAELGCAPATVLQALRRNGLAVRSAQRQLGIAGPAAPSSRGPGPPARSNRELEAVT